MGWIIIIQEWSHRVHRGFDLARTNPREPRGPRGQKAGDQGRGDDVQAHVHVHVVVLARECCDWTKVLLPL